MSSKRVLYITQEIFPYLPESNISTISRHLPQAIQEKGREIRTFMPRFGNINERRNQLHEVIRLSGMNLIINDTDHPLIIKVASIQAARMQIYFIDNDDFFSRKFTTEDDNGEEFADNDERSIFYVRGVMETIKKLRWIPDIIHCHGWMTALTPLFIKRAYADDPCFKGSKIVYSLYGDEMKRPFSPDFINKVSLDGITDDDVKDLEGETDFVKLTNFALKYSDGVIQSSETINPQLLKSAQESGIPFLPFNPDFNTWTEEVNSFYEQF
ncbi:MAG: glycogen synthase [Bacteroidales bacterium 45-6]|nr:MAG: glycogen synthase [Bacteroidales bacterium 45-6]